MLPDWLRDKLANPPQAGAGVHPWLFQVARQLHAHMPPEAAAAVLSAATVNCGRRIPAREIQHAVNNSMAVAWTRGGEKPLSIPGRKGVMGIPMSNGAHDRQSWPTPSPRARRFFASSVSAEVPGLYDLWERSPMRCDDWTSDDWHDALFPDAEWLCLAKDHPATARSRRREKWSFGPADDCGLIVPSPMTGPSGIGLDGERTHRCLDNTGGRRWLVIEWDKSDGVKIPIDEQAALHWYLRECCLVVGWPSLGLVVHSGSKSLHGWYGPIKSEHDALGLMGYAASLEADTATWNRSQLVRNPAGVRCKKGTAAAVNLPDEWENGVESSNVRQGVYYFDPDVCQK